MLKDSALHDHNPSGWRMFQLGHSKRRGRELSYPGLSLPGPEHQSGAAASPGRRTIANIGPSYIRSLPLPRGRCAPHLPLATREMGMEQAKDDIDDLVVDCTVRLSELNEDPAEALVHEINGTIHLVDPDAGEQVFPIGHLTAYLFNITERRVADAFMFDAYDRRTQHLSETYARICDLDEDDFDDRMLKEAGFDDPLLVQWHLHASSLYLKPEFRSGGVV
jgi:hypothetical protein